MQIKVKVPITKSAGSVDTTDIREVVARLKTLFVPSALDVDIFCMCVEVTHQTM